MGTKIHKKDNNLMKHSRSMQLKLIVQNGYVNE